MKISLNLLKRMIVHGMIGALIGYFILHPFSMFIYHNFEKEMMAGENILLLSFSLEHFAMAMFFAVLGMTFGIVHGIYIQRISNLYDKVKELSVTDDLTSLYNRRHLFKRLDEEIARAARYSKQLYLLMIDIDDFKHFNDSCGHQEGDKVLRKFGELFKKSVRIPDFLARYGGEEFIILMPEADENTALIAAQRLCAAVAGNDFSDSENSPMRKFTISVGVAGFPGDARDTTDLIRKADTALYQAKEQGKNRVAGSRSNNKG